MQRPRLLSVILGAVLATLGASSPEAGDLEGNRRLLERWRGDPDHYQRLQRDLRAFYVLPPARQEQLRRLDQQLHTGDLATQTRLWAVLDRYASWLDKLPEEKRKLITDAADAGQRLAVIRELRCAEWLERLPMKSHQEVMNLPPEQRGARVIQLRQQERQQRQQWQKLHQSREEAIPRPTKLTEFPAEVKQFIDQSLLPRLAPEERERLMRAQGKWPELVRTVMELAELHPVLPPLPSGPITRWQELPVELRTPETRELLKKKMARWPEFALEAVRVLKSQHPNMPPLGASRPGEFPAEIQMFIKDKLMQALSPEQQAALVALEGRWPDYPLRLLKLAQQKRLVVPVMSLPGPVEMWTNARAALPDVPDRLLYQFVRDEMTSEDRARMELSANDPMGSREKVKKAYYRQKMDEQSRKERRLLMGESTGVKNH